MICERRTLARRGLFLGALLLTVPAVAAGQYELDGMDLSEEIERPREDTPRLPPRGRDDPLMAQPTPAQPQHEAEPVDRDYRPADSWALGLGAGWQLPRGILEPNTASARIAFPGTITLEPQVVLAVEHRSGTLFVSSPQLDDDIDEEASEQLTELTVGTQLRLPVKTRGNLDLQVLGGAMVGHIILPEEFPEDDDVTDRSSITITTLQWGLGIEWFFRRNIAVSIDAANPLLQWQISRFERTAQVEFTDPETMEEETGEEQTRSRESTLAAGFIFDPRVRLMFHIYF